MGITKGCLVESEEPAIAVVAPPDRAPRVDVAPLDIVDARLGLAAKTSTLLLLLGPAAPEVAICMSLDTAFHGPRE